MATKKSSSKKSTAKKSGAIARAAKSAGASHSMPKDGKDPRGGLTAKGRAYFAKTEGAHLRPGVQGPADTPEKMVRKGSFLRRHFAHPRGPVKDEKGQPTRLALSAHAWGEPVPQTMADTRRLAAKGHDLLEEYHQIKEGEGKSGRGRSGAAKKSAAKTARKAGNKAASKRTTRPAAKTSAKPPAKKRTGAKAAAKQSGRKAAGRAGRP